jgi:hypothetical protein
MGYIGVRFNGKREGNVREDVIQINILNIILIT